MVRSRSVAGAPVRPPEPSRVDLHSHTARSDGTLEPADLARAAAAAGVRILAITDHDNLAAVRELMADATTLPAGLELLAGVEINTVADGEGPRWGGELHVLGLGVDPTDDAFEAVLADQRARRRERFVRTLALLRSIGMAVDDLAATLPQDGRDALGRPTIARFLVEKGHAASVDEAFARIVGAGRPGYVPRDGIGPLTAIRAIRAAGGVPVLAHTADAADRRADIAELRDSGLGGLEVHYRRYDAETVASVAAVAFALRLVPTGGSDFHGDGETYAEAHTSIWVPIEDADALNAALEERAYVAGPPAWTAGLTR